MSIAQTFDVKKKKKKKKKTGWLVFVHDLIECRNYELPSDTGRRVVLETIALRDELSVRDARWSEAVAVGIGREGKSERKSGTSPSDF